MYPHVIENGNLPNIWTSQIASIRHGRNVVYWTNKSRCNELLSYNPTIQWSVGRRFLDLCYTRTL